MWFCFASCFLFTCGNHMKCMRQQQQRTADWISIIWECVWEYAWSAFVSVSAQASHIERKKNKAIKMSFTLEFVHFTTTARIKIQWGTRTHEIIFVVFFIFLSFFHLEVLMLCCVSLRFSHFALLLLGAILCAFLFPGFYEILNRRFYKHVDALMESSIESS